MEEFCARPFFDHETEDDPTRINTPITIYTMCEDLKFSNAMKLKQMPGDNSCMFHAIACSLSWKFKTTASELRRLTVDYMTTNIKALCKLAGISENAMAKHINTLKDKNTFGESIDMLAIASMCNTTIKINNEDQKICLSIRPSNNLPNVYQLDHSMSYLQYKNNHYNVYV